MRCYPCRLYYANSENAFPLRGRCPSSQTGADEVEAAASDRLRTRRGGDNVFAFPSRGRHGLADHFSLLLTNTRKTSKLRSYRRGWRPRQPGKENPSICTAPGESVTLYVFAGGCLMNLGLYRTGRRGRRPLRHQVTIFTAPYGYWNGVYREHGDLQPCHFSARTGKIFRADRQSLAALKIQQRP